MIKKNKKVLVALSGGVDSAMASKFLLAQGYAVEAVYCLFWKENLKDPSLDLAKEVANQLKIPFNVLDLRQVFKEKVVDYFLTEYASGRTPNPCVRCNKQVKLGEMLKYAQARGFDYLATGHYLTLAGRPGRRYLLRGRDVKKDQSYFLYSLRTEDLDYLLFPLGRYKKTKIRQEAKKENLFNAETPESQDICFLSGAHNNFLKNHLKLQSGPIILEETKEKIGEHQGLPLYTVGHRRGIEIGGTGPYYVVGFDYEQNILKVAKTWNDSRLYRRELLAQEVNWNYPKKPRKNFPCRAMIRYGHPAESCRLTIMPEGKIRVVFKKPQRAITAGQSVVFYRGRRLLGGGIIA